MNNQSSLFGSPAAQVFEWDDSGIVYLAKYFHHLTVYEELRQTIAWEQSDILLYGKRMKIPRLNAWYGDKDCHYTYSGKYFAPHCWTPLLENLKGRAEAALQSHLSGAKFNSALVNYYRDGADSVAWHSDDEPELGQNPFVASISFGAERVFHIRHKENKHNNMNLSLGDGDLLLMYGSFQHHWQHAIPKVKAALQQQTQGRISITFRHVHKNLS